MSKAFRPPHLAIQKSTVSEPSDSDPEVIDLVSDSEPEVADTPESEVIDLGGLTIGCIQNVGQAVFCQVWTKHSAGWRVRNAACP